MGYVPSREDVRPVLRSVPPEENRLHGVPPLELILLVLVQVLLGIGASDPELHAEQAHRSGSHPWGEAARLHYVRAAHA